MKICVTSIGSISGPFVTKRLKDLGHEVIGLNIQTQEYLIDRLSTQDDPQNNLKPIDSLVYKEFVKKFNDKYGASLMEEQKQLLTKYIASYSNDDIDFKVYLNEEIGRIKQIVISSKQITESKQREGLVNILESFRTNQITPAMIEKVLKLQQLVKELV